MKAVFAGTFDPFTVGHADIVERALAVFGGVTVVVAEQTGKNTASIADRVDIVKRSVSTMRNVSVVSFDGLLSDFVKSCGDCVLVRGVRNNRDLDYERELASVYKRLCGADTVFFVSSPSVADVSSTVVRELAALGAPLDGFVADETKAIAAEIYGRRSSEKEKSCKNI